MDGGGGCISWHSSRQGHSNLYLCARQEYAREIQKCPLGRSFKFSEGAYFSSSAVALLISRADANSYSHSALGWGSQAVPPIISILNSHWGQSSYRQWGSYSLPSALTFPIVHVAKMMIILRKDLEDDTAKEEEEEDDKVIGRALLKLIAVHW